MHLNSRNDQLNFPFLIWNSGSKIGSIENLWKRALFKRRFMEIGKECG